jgi:hypothetical protein
MGSLPISWDQPTYTTAHNSHKFCVRVVPPENGQVINSNKLIQSDTTIYCAKVVRVGYMFRPRFEAIFRPFVAEQLIKITYEMLACYGIPYSFTELIQIHRSTKSVYGMACWMPCLVGCRKQVHWLRDVVSLAVLIVCYHAPYDYKNGQVMPETFREYGKSSQILRPTHIYNCTQ